MDAQIQKWGNSLGIRIPKALAVDANLAEGSLVELSLDDGRIILTPAVKEDLSSLLAQVTDNNLHDETDFGDAEGREGW